MAIDRFPIPTPDSGFFYAALFTPHNEWPQHLLEWLLFLMPNGAQFARR